MRYQWGLGVGHTYAHTTMRQEDDPTAVQDFEDFEEGEVLHCDPGCGASNSCSDSESELGFDSDQGSTSDEGCNSDSDQSLDYEN
jgi:hypothetical protein